MVCWRILTFTTSLFPFLAVVPSLRAELLGATVGNSVLIPCKLPVPLTLHWVYWQEDGTENILIHCDPNCPAASSNDSVTAFESEFRSGNISIRLHGVTAADDRRSFWAFAQYTDAANTEKTCEQCCRATLQVSGKSESPRSRWRGSSAFSPAHRKCSRMCVM